MTKQQEVSQYFYRQG